MMVTADHVLFAECLPALRRDLALPARRRTADAGGLVGHILLSFELPTDWPFDDFTVQASQRVALPGGRAAFVSRVLLPSWVGRETGHSFTVALSTALSFATGRPIKTPRDDHWVIGAHGRTDLSGLAIQYPVLVAGPGAHDYGISTANLQRYHESARQTLRVLRKVKPGHYKRILRAMRLVHLSYLTKREDFALGYYLLVSSLEAVAQRAIPVEDVSDNHPDEKLWREKATTDPTVRNLFHAYESQVAGNKYLKRRFTRFVMTHCPLTDWEQMPHPRKNQEEYPGEKHPDFSVSLTGPDVWGVRPSHLTQSQAEAILSDAYSHRSGFTHEGKQPPHQNHEGYDAFFDLVFPYPPASAKPSAVVVPTYGLMSFLARTCIQKYGDGLIQHDNGA